MELFSLPSTTYWRDCFFSIIYSCFLYCSLIDYKYVAHRVVLYIVLSAINSVNYYLIIYKDGKVIMVVEFEAEVPVGDQSGLNQTMSGTFTAHAIFSK